MTSLMSFVKGSESSAGLRRDTYCVTFLGFQVYNSVPPILAVKLLPPLGSVSQSCKPSN